MECSLYLGKGSFLSHWPHYCDKMSDERNYEGRVYFGPRVQGAVHHLRKVMQKELEAAAHIVSTVRKQREMSAGIQSRFPLYSISDPALWDGGTHN